MIKLFIPIFFSAANLHITDSSDSSERPRKVAIEVSYAYMELSQIFPSQLRYSSENVRAKINETQRAGGAVWDEENASWVLKHDDGLSSLHLDDAVPVVKGPYGYYLCDGHHHILASMQFGAKTMPVKVIADLSALDETKFWEEMEKRGWAYPYNILGERATPPMDFKRLQDDPNRYFAALIARKCPPGGDLRTSRGAEYPVWIKVGQDIPFIEFRIADALWKQGLRYEYSMGSNPPEQFIEESRRILKEANIPGLKIVPERTHYLILSENQQSE